MDKDGKTMYFHNWLSGWLVGLNALVIDHEGKLWENDLAFILAYGFELF